MSVYTFLFGIMGTVEEIEAKSETSIIEEGSAGILLPEDGQQEQFTVTTPVTQTLSPEGEIAYSTSLNVANPAKPHLVDYNATLSTVTNPPIETISAATGNYREPAYVVDDSDYETTSASVSFQEDTPAVTVTTTPAATTTTAAETTTTTAKTTVPPAITTAEAAATTPIIILPDATEATTTTASEVVADADAAKEILTVYHNTGGQNVSDDAVTIISKIVQAEIGSSFNEEAIKAQAIAAYTYVKYYNDRGKVPTAALSTPTSKVTKCVTEVIGIAIYYNGDYIQSVYGASTAGYTASAANVWGVDYPYLRSKYCELDAQYDPNYGVKKTFTATEMQNMVYSATGIYLDGDPSGWFAIKSYVDNVYVGEMTIGGQSTYTTSAGKTKTITGRVLRETIMNYKLRSACFELDYDSTTGKFTFTTYGYGHCVGFSQHGANNLANHWGYNYKQILDYYFPGTTLK